LLISRACSSFVCHSSSASVESLERLAEHHVFAGRRVERAEMQVRELAGAPAVAPFRRQHDEIAACARA
jgi:hypothetical protein